MSPRIRVRLALGLLIASLIGWPLSAVSFARHEPATVLGLSWFAISLTAADILVSTDVRRKQEDDEDP
jgi:uncharacterized membrane protein YfcA